MLATHTRAPAAVCVIADVCLILDVCKGHSNSLVKVKSLNSREGKRKCTLTVVKYFEVLAVKVIGDVNAVTSH